MNIMSDISSDDLVAVRNRLTGLSFAISVYYLFGGKVMPSEVVLNYCKGIMPDFDMSSAVFIIIPLTNVVFCDGSNLIYVLWVLMGWWLFRYLTLGSWDGYQKRLKRDIASALMQDISTKEEVKMQINRIDSSHGYSLIYENRSDGLYINLCNSNSEAMLYEVKIPKSKLNMKVIFIVIFFRSSTLTFFLPLLLLLCAFSLTAYS